MQRIFGAISKPKKIKRHDVNAERTLFDWRNEQEARRIEVARAAREAGIEKAAGGAGSGWVGYAIGFVREYLQGHATLFVDDLWTAGLQRPASARALGAVMQHARRKGWIWQIETDEGFVAARPSVNSNMQLKRVWRSGLCGKVGEYE